MKKIQVTGVHHITMIGANRQSSIDFWEGVLGMPFVFEQPNLDVPEESHLYFDPGDGRLLTVFTNENREVDPSRNPEGIGNLHHLAFTVSQATYSQIATRLDERGISHTGEIDRGFMHSIYFRDPLGQLIECASYKFIPPEGSTYTDVLFQSHKLRVARGDHHIDESHLADAIEYLATQNTQTLSADRSPKDPYIERPPVWD